MEKQKFNRTNRLIRAFLWLAFSFVLGVALLNLLPSYFLTPNYEAYISSAEAQMNTINVALNQYKTLNRRLPSSEEGLAALVNPPASARVKRSLTTSSAILDPWGKPFQHRTSYDSDTSAHVLWSFGPDGLDGTEDDITLRHESTVPHRP